MKKLLVLLGSALVVTIAIVILSGGDRTTPQRSALSDQGFYAMKRGGKVPKVQKRPSDWFYVQRAYPEREVPVLARLKAAEQARQLRAEAALDKSAIDVTWQEAGPTNIPGRITDLAVHPSNPDVIYAASAAGGVFKSSDGGTNWQAIFDSMGVQSIGAVAINPFFQNVVYVGTGEANSSGDSYEGTGMYRSNDAGATWSHIGLDSSFHIGRIAITQSFPETLFVAAMGKLFGTNPQRGVYRSTDSGATWQQKLYLNDSTGCVDIAIDPVSGNIYAAMWERWRHPRERRAGGMASGLYRSTDGGENWTLLGNGLPAPADTLGRIGVAVNSNTVYAIAVNHPGYFMGVYKSTDFGDSWTQTNDGALWNLTSSFGWYFGQIRVAPNNPDVVFALGVYLFRSTNGGSSWSEFGSGAHVDHHAMWISQIDPNDIVDGSDGGVNISTNMGVNFTVMADMHNTQFYAIDIDPTNPERLYGGTQDNGTLRTLTGSLSDWDHIHGGDGFYTIVDPTDPDVIYAEYQWGYLDKSTDGGYYWDWAMNGIDSNDRTNWSTPFVMDPSDHNTLYYGSHRLYKTTNGASNWTAISNDLTDGDDPGGLVFGTITTIDVSRLDGDVIYVGTDDANVWVTSDGGTNWSSINSELPNRWITRVVADPLDVNTAYVTLSGYKENDALPHIYRTTDKGQNWTAIHGNLPDAPIADVIVDPVLDSTLYVGTDFGVYYTENLGGSWAALGTGMPMVPLHDICFHAASRKLVAGTHGRSMYMTSIPGTSPDDADSDGVPDSEDNCPEVYNPGQLDDDGDDIGDVCDNCPSNYNPGQEDADADDVGNLCDNCIDQYNPEQTDLDLDGVGDSCDTCTDSDGDGFGNPGYAANTCPDDNCPNVYNPGQEDSDLDGIGDSCDYRELVWDTVSTGCTRLAVSTNGSFGLNGVGKANLDYAAFGDCEASNPNSHLYLYHGTPVVSYINGDDTVANLAIFGTDTWLRVDNAVQPETTTVGPDFQRFRSGTFVTNDRTLALDKTWWAPLEIGTCYTYVVQRLRLYSYDGQSHSGLTIGEIVDWDIPTDSLPTNNASGYNATRRMVYQQGVETNGAGCQANDARFGGIAYLGHYLNDPCSYDSAAQPWGGYTGDNYVWAYPSAGFVPAELYQNMSQPGYSIDPTLSDMHTVMTYFHDLTILPEDTLSIYIVLASVQNGNVYDLISSVQHAATWAQQFAVPSCGCCKIRADINHDGQPQPDIADLVYLVTYMFQNGPAPICDEPYGPECLQHYYSEADINGDGTCVPDISDLVYMVTYMFQDGPPPIPCP